MWVNPGAGASWAKSQAFTGTWKIDNFSIGYSGTAPSGCTTIRDDDKDGVKNENDKCIETAPGASVNSNGCSASQLDDDKDGVFNIDDKCPATATGATVDYKGCSAAQADDDNDGVKNTIDVCPNTPAGQTVNATGCAQSELDDDKDGVFNPNDLCANTPVGQAVNTSGCSTSQLDTDKDAKKIKPNEKKLENEDSKPSTSSNVVNIDTSAMPSTSKATPVTPSPSGNSDVPENPSTSRSAAMNSEAVPGTSTSAADDTTAEQVCALPIII